MKTTLYIKLILLVTLQCVVLGNSYFAQGDDPCTATSLTVNTSCSFANYTYASSSTGSTGIPAPGCASYPAGGDDVWFSAVVPASGILIVDMNTTNTGPSDMGMAFYSASSCAGPFTLIECDDDDSNNGSMPYINRPGLTPGTTVYIRVWEYGADTYGTFKICASTSTSSSCIGSNNASCSVADPFCTGTAYNYCNTTGVSSMGSYSCLFSTPNPMWMYLNIQTTGAIDILIEQFTTSGTAIDVDFALYGPYSGISAACSAITGSTSTVDCSFSSAATETANISNAVAGQWYMLLITNYNGAAGYIEFTQTGGSGSTNCNIVNPTCLITGVTATPTTCNASNQYSVSGAVSFTNPPASGTMTVTSSCGGTQTFNAPFTSPLNYNLTGITPTGASCTVTASFSALSCSQTQTYTAPAIPTVNGGVDQTVCASTGVTLSGAGASTYSWTGGISNGTSFTPVSTATYTVTGTNAQGCTATDQVQVTVNALPTTNAGADVPICAGASTTLTATGATTYTWSPSTGLSGTSGASVTANPAATVTYTVTGTTGTCTATDQVIVTVTPLPTINAGTDQTICTGSSATLTATGGTTYTWSPSTSLSATTGSSVTSSATSTITYTVTGTTSGCTNTDLVIVNVNPFATANANVDQSVCAGGTVTLAGSVGGSATTGTWSASSGSFSNSASLTSTYTPSITSGTVTLTLTSNDPTGPCPAVIDQMVITVNPLPTPNAGTDESYCPGGSTALSATGGTTYSWSPSTALNTTSGATVTANPSSTTTYTVTATSASGCTATDAVVVTVNTLPTINAGTDQTLCQGPNVTLAATGASTYTWTGGITNGTAFVPATGATTYTVTGTDANGCTNTDAVIVTVNPLPVVIANNVSVCTTNTVAVTASGANTYSWSPATALSATTGSSVTFTPGTTTTYTVTGTSTAGCTSTDQVTVSVLANAPINAGADLSICAGASTTLTASGGTTYSWDNGLGTGNGFSVSPASTTTYTVIGTDAAGCQGTDAVTVTVNPLPVVNAGTDQTVCAGVSVTLSGSGATTYSWDQGVTNGASFVPASTQTYTVTGTSLGCTATDQVLVTVNALPITNAGGDQTVCAGIPVVLTGSGANSYSWSSGVSNGVSFTPTSTVTYTLTGTTLAGCTATDLVIVTVNPLPVLNAGTDQSVCDGTSVTLTGTGASTYSWNNGVTNGVAFTPIVGSQTYTVTGTSAAGCSATDQVVVTVNPNPTPVIQGPTAYCTGNFAVLSTSATYTTYSWSNGATTATINATIADNPITVTVTNSFGCPATSGAYTVLENSVITANFSTTICQGESALIHGVSQTVAGVYSQTFTSATGCDSVANVTLVVNPLPAINGGVDQTFCDGLSTSLTATGASTYSWNNGITNGVTFTPVVGSLTYTVTGTSAEGCTATDQVVVTVNALPVIGAGGDQAVCSGVQVTLDGSGGSNYTWNNGVSNGVSFTPAVTTTYTVTGTDVNGCTGTDQVQVTVNSLPVVGAGTDQEVCEGVQVTLAGSGASTYNWDNGVTNGVAFTPTTSQTYTVTGTDVNGCTGTDQVLVTVNAIPSVGAGADQSVCPGTTVTLSGSGAATYTWNNGVSNGVGFIPGVGSVTYTVTGTSTAGCSATDQVSVVVNPNPVVSAGTDQSVCFNEQVTLSGTGASIYSWTNSVTDGELFTPSSTITYTVTGTDVNGCTGTDQVTVTVNPLPIVSAGNDLSICEGAGMTLTGSGAGTYSWDNGVQNGVTFNPPLGTTTYTVTGTTSANCTGTDQVNITVNALPVVNFDADTTQGCIPLQVSFTNGTSNSSSCVWTLSDGTVLIGCGSVSHWFNTSGCFDVSLSITDNNGCVSSSSANDLVCVDAPPIASFEPSSNELSTYDTEVFFDNTSYGATSYDWVFGDPNGSNYSTEENPSHTYPNEGGEYNVLLTAYSASGCLDTAWAKIIVKEDIIFYVPNTFTPDDDGYNETFKPIFTSGFDPYEYDFYVYNRWGQIVFESHNSEVGWNGSYGSNQEITTVQDGTYTWLIRYRLIESNGYRKVTGHVNVIR